VKQPYEQEQEGATHQARTPKRPCQTEVGEQHRNQGNGHHCSQALHSLQEAYRHAHACPEPDGDPGHQRHLINRQWDGQDDAEVQIEMPEAGHAAGEHHAHGEQASSQEHSATDTIPIPKPAHQRTDERCGQPLEGKSDGDGEVAPAEPLGTLQVGHQHADGEPHGGGDHTDY
jgi:hypothetical protein